MDLWKRFKRCYEARALDSVLEKMGTRQRRIDFSIRILPSKKGRVLDLGSGDGLLLETLGADNAIGSDISIVYCRRMKSKKLEAVNCVAEHLPFASNSFSIIVCTEVLEHTLYPSEVVKEIRRVSKKDGHTLFSVPYREDLTSYENCRYEFAHLRSFEENDIISMLERFFAIDSVDFYAFHIILTTLHGYYINKIFSVVWKFFFIKYQTNFLRKFFNLFRPIYILILARKYQRLESSGRRHCARSVE
ncbi:MAG: class I SAM-dependent methyltransferase [Candidatus Bathyarchaeum sp.]|nr:MAG: class I SAM-dependent methyltransferase [Candidatus Bathyarchaeum sp.]